MFEASHPFAFFDYFRVPYDVSPPAALPDRSRMLAPVGRLHALRQAEDPVRSLFWLRPDGGPGPPDQACQLGRYRLGDFTLFGRIALNAAVPEMLRGLGRGWRPADAVTGAGDQPVAAVWRDDDGNVFLPFDPGEVMHYFWSEKYRDVGRSALSGTVRAVALRSYYMARPLLPRRLQLRLRRVLGDQPPRQCRRQNQNQAEFHSELYYSCWRTPRLGKTAPRTHPASCSGLPRLGS